MAATQVALAIGSSRVTARDFLQLTKPRLSSLVLFTTAGGNPENVVNLRVTRLEGRKVIADFAPGPLAAGLRSGDIVYYWKPSPAP